MSTFKLRQYFSSYIWYKWTKTCVQINVLFDVSIWYSGGQIPTLRLSSLRVFSISASPVPKKYLVHSQRMPICYVSKPTSVGLLLGQGHCHLGNYPALPQFNCRLWVVTQHKFNPSDSNILHTPPISSGLNLVL